MNHRPTTPPVRELDTYLIALPARERAARLRLGSLGFRRVITMPPRVMGYPEGVVHSYLDAFTAGVAAGSYPFNIVEDDLWPTDAWQPDYAPPPGADCVGLTLSWAVNTRGPLRHEAVDEDYARVYDMLGIIFHCVCTEDYARAVVAAAEASAARDPGCPIDCLMQTLQPQFRFLVRRRPLFYQGPESNPNAPATGILL